MYLATNAFALVSWTLVCADKLFISLTTNLLCLLCILRLRSSVRQSRSLHYQTTNLPSSCKASYGSVLIENYNNCDQTSTLNSAWDASKFSILKACESLHPAPKISDSDWIIDKVCNLSRKKQEACVYLRNAPSNDISYLKIE